MFALILCTIFTCSALVPVQGILVIERIPDVEQGNYSFFPAVSDVVNIGIKSENCVDILFSETPDVSYPYYKILLGCASNDKWLQLCKNDELKVEVTVPSDVLNSRTDQLNNFTIYKDDSGYIALGKKGDWHPFFFWKDTDSSQEIPDIMYFGIRTKSNDSSYYSSPDEGQGIYFNYASTWIEESLTRANVYVLFPSTSNNIDIEAVSGSEMEFVMLTNSSLETLEYRILIEDRGGDHFDVQIFKKDAKRKHEISFTTNANQFSISWHSEDHFYITIKARKNQTYTSSLTWQDAGTRRVPEINYLGIRTSPSLPDLAVVPMTVASTRPPLPTDPAVAGNKERAKAWIMKSVPAIDLTENFNSDTFKIVRRAQISSGREVAALQEYNTSSFTTGSKANTTAPNPSISTPGSALTTTSATLTSTPTPETSTPTTPTIPSTTETTTTTTTQAPPPPEHHKKRKKWWKRIIG